MAKRKKAAEDASEPQAGGSVQMSAPALEFSAIMFRRQLSAWYEANARKLPWRGVDDPYATWLSEIMLQQTRVAAVIDRYKVFRQRFPTIRALAAADEAEVLALWSGLGYYRRARMLLRGAQFVEREMKGELPRTMTELRRLPGVGEYTAAAIASIAFGRCVAVLDGNVERVLLRLRGEPATKSAHARLQLLKMAQTLVPAANPAKAAKRRKARAGSVPQTHIPNPAGDHNQAMMELGATICLPRSPLCGQCPVFEFCKTQGEHATPKRPKMLSRNVAHLLAVRKHGVETEVLLECRPSDASLMGGMMELPVLPMEAVEGREPVLRLRHAITNTNYYAQIFTEGVMAVPSPSGSGDDAPAEGLRDRGRPLAHPMGHAETSSLMNALTASDERLAWVTTGRLPQKPLTGLTRKALQRLHLMDLPRVEFDESILQFEE
jgi:A/G-specific adenine glycosylase